MAEAHPVGFRHPMIAKEKGAKLIHVDPRFTRTSAMCDIYAPIRPGTDIAFLGGLINYVLENEEYFEEYVKVYTNAATIITEDFEEADASGLFSGWDEENNQYDPSSWRYEGHADRLRLRRGEPGHASWARPARARAGRCIPGMPRPTDMTLEHPRCVFQILKRHFARYTPEMVEKRQRHPEGGFPRGSQDPVPRTRGARRPRRSATPSAGRSIPRACRSSARRRSCSSSSATSGVPAAASWRCGARDHPGLDRHRHPLRHPSRLSADAGREQGPRYVGELRGGRDRRDGLVEQLPQVHNQPDEGLVRREVRSRERRSSSTTSRASRATTPTTPRSWT